jgi:ubiquinone/menaquinone biosynthesis C-methylase UbiE
MRLLTEFLRLFFFLLYHHMAWSYDLVADIVSLGRWKAWVLTTLPYIQGTRVLELGHGPGHLQRHLLDLGLYPVGLDESRQMGTQAKRRLRKAGYTKVGLVRGKAQVLPFLAGAFDTILATFPSEYIFDARTLTEVHRTLRDAGRFIILPVAWITGKSLVDRFLAWIFRFTGQAPSSPVELLGKNMKGTFLKAGFQVDIRQVDMSSSLVLIILANKEG